MAEYYEYDSQARYVSMSHQGKRHNPNRTKEESVAPAVVPATVKFKPREVSIPEVDENGNWVSSPIANQGVSHKTVRHEEPVVTPERASIRWASQVFGSSIESETGDRAKAYLIDRLDTRNQLFEVAVKTFDEYVDDTGVLVESGSDVSLKKAQAFYNCYVVFSGPNVVGIKVQPTPPEVENGQFWINIPGYLTKDKVNVANINKPGTILYTLCKKHGFDVDGWRLVWYKAMPHLYRRASFTLVPINIVDGKSVGFGSPFSYNEQ